MQLKSILALALFPALCVIRPVSAEPITLRNSRPVAVSTIIGEPGTQALLDAVFGPGTNVSSSQSSAALWQVTTFPYALGASLEFEYAGYNKINMFGLWSGSDTSSVRTVPVFLGAATGTGSGVKTQASVTWNGTGTEMSIAGDCSSVNCGTFTDIDPLRFGFYMQVGMSGPSYYSLDALNVGGQARAIAFQQQATDNWFIAFEDFTDGDFNDGVVRATSIAPSGASQTAAVPEPAPIVLMGTGALAIALLERRRRARRHEAAFG